MVEGVEPLAPKLKIVAFAKTEVLHQPGIDVPEAGSPHAVPSDITERVRSGRGECRRIEPALHAPVRHAPVSDHIRSPAARVSDQCARVIDVIRRPGAKRADTGELPPSEQMVGDA